MPSIRIEDAPKEYQHYLTVGDLRGCNQNGSLDVEDEGDLTFEPQYAADEFFYENSASDYQAFVKYLEKHSFKVELRFSNLDTDKFNKSLIHQHFKKFEVENDFNVYDPSEEIVKLFNSRLPLDVQKYALNLLLKGLKSDSAKVREASADTLQSLAVGTGYHFESDIFSGVSQKLLIDKISPLLRFQKNCGRNTCTNVSGVISSMARSHLPASQRQRIVNSLLKRLDPNEDPQIRLTAIETLEDIVRELDPRDEVGEGLKDIIGKVLLNYLKDQRKSISDTAMDILIRIGQANISNELREKMVVPIVKHLMKNPSDTNAIVAVGYISQGKINVGLKEFMVDHVVNYINLYPAWEGYKIVLNSIKGINSPTAGEDVDNIHGPEAEYSVPTAIEQIYKSGISAESKAKINEALAVLMVNHFKVDPRRQEALIAVSKLAEDVISAGHETEMIDLVIKYIESINEFGISKETADAIRKIYKSNITAVSKERMEQALEQRVKAKQNS